MVLVARPWTLDVERGPNLLIIKVKGDDAPEDEMAELAESVWSVLDAHHIYRVVLDCAQLPPLSVSLIVQFEQLHKRVLAHEGMLRLCALSKANKKALRASGFDKHFTTYDCCEEAVADARRKPR